jgi:hypothetical protein
MLALLRLNTYEFRATPKVFVAHILYMRNIYPIRQIEKFDGLFSKTSVPVLALGWSW